KKKYIAKFLQEFGIEHNNMSNVDVDFETIAMKNGGIELMHDELSLRPDGYQVAFDNMASFSEKIKNFSAKPVEIKAEKKEIHAQNIDDTDPDDDLPRRPRRIFKWF